MKKIAIYPGTFDPITFGHIDVIRKALKIVNTVIVAISDGSSKNYLFDEEERIEIIKKALFKDLRFKKNNIKIISFKSLTTDLCNKYKANIINTPKFEGSVYLIVDVVQLIIDLAVLQHSCGIYKTFFNLLSPAEEQRLVLNEVVSIFLTDGRYGRRKKSSHSILYDLALF